MKSPGTSMPQSSLADSIHDRLRAETRCELRFDRPGRMLYSTDASLYQVEPMGVAVPRTREDLRIAVQVAAELGAAVVPRGAATSLSGQTIGKALILDVSKYLNRIGIVDRDQGLVTVEPGVVLDQLNAHLKPLGLMFGPDVSTSDRATLGGMIGNNSAGGAFASIRQNGRPRRISRRTARRRLVGNVQASGRPRARWRLFKERSLRKLAPRSQIHRPGARTGHSRSFSPHPTQGQRI